MVCCCKKIVAINILFVPSVYDGNIYRGARCQRIKYIGYSDGTIEIDSDFIFGTVTSSWFRAPMTVGLSYAHGSPTQITSASFSFLIPGYSSDYFIDNIHFAEFDRVTTSIHNGGHLLDEFSSFSYPPINLGIDYWWSGNDFSLYFIVKGV